MMELQLPRHEASLCLTHNVHRDYYQTVEQWESAEAATSWPASSWVSPEERAKAIAADSVWTLLWHPDTPVGFYALCASSLDALLAAANSIQALEKKP